MDIVKIQDEASAFAFNLWTNAKKEHLKESELTAMFESDFSGMENGKVFLMGLILGAIEEYHYQLREELIKSGIDIGEMKP